MPCGLARIAFCIGIDPTLPRAGTDLMTPRILMRILFGFGTDSAV
jgi:hypothetical protein